MENKYEMQVEMKKLRSRRDNVNIVLMWLGFTRVEGKVG